MTFDGEWIYLTAAVVGGTLMIVQFMASLLGFGHGHDFATDGHDFAGHDASHDSDHDHAANSLFSILTLRTAAAGLTFFGLAGLAAHAASWDAAPSVGTALASGAVAVYCVHTLMRGLHRLRSDGTVYSSQLIGARGQVYLRIPAAAQAAGKVHLVLRGRMLEYEAITQDSDELRPTERVEVVALAGPETVEVKRV